VTSSHVLVVDDEVDIRALIKDILTDEGYGVTVAADAEEARKARADQEFDLILLDIWMPDTDGITLLREWSDSGDLKCPVVIMSGHGTGDSTGRIRFCRKAPVVGKTVAHRRSGPGVGKQTVLGGARVIAIAIGAGGAQPAYAGIARKGAAIRPT